MSRRECSQKYSVRFIGITKAELDVLKSSFEITHKSLLPYERKEGTYVLVFELTEAFDGSLVADRLKSINDAICDVFISVRTNYDSEIVDIPKYVTKFVSDSGADLTFSFTVS